MRLALLAIPHLCKATPADYTQIWDNLIRCIVKFQKYELLQLNLSKPFAGP